MVEMEREMIELKVPMKIMILTNKSICFRWIIVF